MHILLALFLRRTLMQEGRRIEWKQLRLSAILRGFGKVIPESSSHQRSPASPRNSLALASMPYLVSD